MTIFTKAETGRDLLQVAVPAAPRAVGLPRVLVRADLLVVGDLLLQRRALFGLVFALQEFERFLRAVTVVA